MSWNTSVVTNAGVDLLNESLAGHTLTIESAVGGAGTQTEDEIKAATDVAEPKQALKLTGIEDFEDGKRIGIQITNEGISESYILHQIGVKAHLEYEEDLTLLFVLQDERGVEIPTEAENPDFIFEVYAVISISNEANIDVTVNTGVTASVSYVDEKVSSEISEHSEDTNSHQDIRDMATEAYDPESTYDAGAYCIYDGKLYKALDDISTPEAWTESHWEETSVGAELLELEAALSNKVSHCGNITEHNTVLDAASALMVDGTFFGDPSSSIYNAADKPPNTTDVGYFVMLDGTMGRRVVLAFGYAADSGHRYVGTRDIYNSEWLNDWRELASATPPQEYNLPLASGWTGTAKYFKTQESVCVISLDISKNAELTTGESVGIVPVGFRPSYVKMSPASTFAPSGATTIGVSTDGSILLGDISGQEQARNIYATIVYIAGN